MTAVIPALSTISLAAVAAWLSLIALCTFSNQSTENECASWTHWPGLPTFRRMSRHGPQPLRLRTIPVFFGREGAVAYMVHNSWWEGLFFARSPVRFLGSASEERA